MSNLIPDWDQPMPLLWTSSTQPPINLSQAWSTAGQPPTQQGISHIIIHLSLYVLFSATASSEEMPLHPYVLDNMQLGPLDFILDNELWVPPLLAFFLEPTKSNFNNFVRYFERTYVGSVSKLPLFDPHLWCHANSHERTSNLCEAYHHSLNALCCIRRPSFYHIMTIIVDGLTEFGQRFARVKAGDACRQPTQTRKQAEATLERAYAATFPEYGGTSWAEAPVRLKEVEYIQYLRACSATLARSRPAKKYSDKP
ncbi:hypothetical protein FOZ60_012283 [Perkinsus olseni]|uniref:Uncharacterized protein n=1 Tax=Perkinsus olseni TaxID=32597 RepID=A0A7J6NBP9_PEROL|nr:hypothetical protein FOZ60_012283 [Perkinsus olseni]